MTSNEDGTATRGADRFDTVEALLIRYPEISAAELEFLTRWFRKEASSFEVASLASKEAAAPGYARFRQEHIDRFSGADMIKAVGFALAVIAIVAAIVLPGL